MDALRHDPERGAAPAERAPSFEPDEPLVDSFGRPVTYVRISVTDRCNLRCVYCMPEKGSRFAPEPELMTAEEIGRFAGVLRRVGVRKVRLTGGEPTTRKDLIEIVERVAANDFPGGLALSTNGVLLRGIAKELARAGVDRLNLSLDALSDDGFKVMSRRSHLGEVVAALDESVALFSKVKVNAVVLGGWNEGEIPALVDLARTRPIEVRFIEFMPYGSNEWTGRHLVPAAEIRRRIEAESPLVPVPGEESGGPADVFTSDGWLGRIGFITPISDRFCARCNRVRITPTGRVQACLFGFHGVDGLAPAREGATDDDLLAILRGAVWSKEERHPLRPGMTKEELALATRNMNDIGG